MPHQVKTVAFLTAKPGRETELHELLDNMAPHCRAEPGNLRWDIWRDHANPERFVLDELYVDGDAVTAHRRSPHYQVYLAKVPDLADRLAVLCDPLGVAQAAA